MKLRMLQEELREEEEMSRLELEVLGEENRRKIPEAKLKEAELEDAMSERSQNHDEAELNDEAANEISRTREWVDNTENNPVVTYGTGNRHKSDSVIAIAESLESLRTSNNVTTAALNEALPGVIVPPVDTNAIILGVNLSPQAAPPFDQGYSTKSSPNFNIHRVFSQAVQNTAIGNHNPLTSVSQSQLPLMNPYARHSSLQHLFVRSHPGLQVKYRPTQLPLLSNSKHDRSEFKPNTIPESSKCYICSDTWILDWNHK